MHWLYYTLPLVYCPGLERILGSPRPPLLEPAARCALAVAAHRVLLRRTPLPGIPPPDHMAVGRTALAVWHGPALLFHTRRPNVAVDITATFPAKVAAFAAHKSQFPRRGAARLAAWHLGRRSACGRRYLEVFHQVTAPPGG